MNYTQACRGPRRVHVPFVRPDTNSDRCNDSHFRSINCLLLYFLRMSDFILKELRSYLLKFYSLRTLHTIDLHTCHCGRCFVLHRWFQQLKTKLKCVLRCVCRLFRSTSVLSYSVSADFCQTVLRVQVNYQLYFN